MTQIKSLNHQLFSVKCLVFLMFHLFPVSFSSPNINHFWCFGKTPNDAYVVSENVDADLDEDNADREFIRSDLSVCDFSTASTASLHSWSTFWSCNWFSRFILEALKSVFDESFRCICIFSLSIDPTFFPESDGETALMDVSDVCDFEDLSNKYASNEDEVAKYKRFSLLVWGLLRSLADVPRWSSAKFFANELFIFSQTFMTWLKYNSFCLFSCPFFMNIINKTSVFKIGVLSTRKIWTTSIASVRSCFQSFITSIVFPGERSEAYSH